MIRDYAYKTEKSQLEMDARNEEIRDRSKKGNVIKWYESQDGEDPFYVGSPDLNDEYSGKPIYLPSEEKLSEIESKEKEARHQMEQNKIREEASVQAPPSQPVSSSSNKADETFDSSSMTDEELRIANEIYARLMNEAAADEAARQAEIDAIRQQQEQAEKDFNASTGSYSGQYGKKPMNDEENDAFLEIMNRNNSSKKTFEDLINENLQ